MSVFRFKQFCVKNEKSAMKVNTDGVLLGAAMTIKPSDKRLLDIGTGTGTIALMAAQRISGMNPQWKDEIRIDAVEIDKISAEEASDNFSESPWTDVLNVVNCPFGEFRPEGNILYDLIFSNPPYFDCSLQAPQFRRNNARHTASGLSFREILEFASERLSDGGRVCLVLPADQRTYLVRYAGMNGLFIHKILQIRTVQRKEPNRIVVEFARERCSAPTEDILTIQHEGKYSSEYLSLTKDFYLFA